jgi:hypothetical protein
VSDRRYAKALAAGVPITEIAHAMLIEKLDEDLARGRVTPYEAARLKFNMRQTMIHRGRAMLSAERE